MSEETLEEMIQQAMAQGDRQVSFGWQGGEPTLMGLPFFEKAVEFQQRFGRGQTVGNGLQTNGILIDEDWSKFLSRYKFLVGLSLDGPEHIHDKYRALKGGGGSWSKVKDKAALMLDNGVEVNALVVVNDYSVKYPEEIYEFHKSIGLTFQQYIPCLETSPDAPGTPTPFSVPPGPLGEFLCRLFDLWMGDFDNGAPTTSIRFFDSLFHTYVGLQAPECTLLKECGVYVVVEHNGDVFSCDFFVDPEWRLGNIHENRLKDMLNSARQTRFGRMKSTLHEECHGCKWLTLCRGGCPKDRIGDPGHASLNHFCPAFKMLFEHIDKGMKELAEGWKQKQFMSQMQQTPPRSRPGEIGRNDPCPCGSGLKYKRCCGAPR